MSALPSTSASRDQIDAARAFVLAFGRLERPYGGGCRVVLRVPGGGWIEGLSGWEGVDGAINNAAATLARKWAAEVYHERFEPLPRLPR